MSGKSNFCPFCADAIHTAVFAMSEHCWAIYNIAPIVPGHTLIIPKQHYSKVLDLPDEMYLDMMKFMRLVSKKLMEIYQASGVNWTLQEGESAGQTIDHLHFHLIPRVDHDMKNPGDWYPKLKEQEMIDSDQRQNISVEEMRTITTWLKSKFETI